MTRCLYIVLLTTLTLMGCGPDEEQVAAQAYVDQMTPLLKRNTTLSRTFLDIAAKIKKDELSTAEVAEQFGARVVPQSAKLRDDVATVRPIPKTAQAVHIGLIRAWDNRARAYQQMHEAWVSGDLATFNGAARDNETVAKAEERYFVSVNTMLEPYGLDLRQYPGQPVERVDSNDVSKAKRGKAKATKPIAFTGMPKSVAEAKMAAVATWVCTLRGVRMKDKFIVSDDGRYEMYTSMKAYANLQLDGGYRLQFSGTWKITTGVFRDTGGTYYAIDVSETPGDLVFVQGSGGESELKALDCYFERR